jgi:hypothetical protein
VSNALEWSVSTRAADVNGVGGEACRQCGRVKQGRFDFQLVVDKRIRKPFLV